MTIAVFPFSETPEKPLIVPIGLGSIVTKGFAQINMWWFEAAHQRLIKIAGVGGDGIGRFTRRGKNHPL